MTESARHSLPTFTAPELHEMAEAGVDARFLHRVQAAGLTGLSAPQMIAMVEVGAEPDLVRAVREAPMAHITL